MSDNAILLRIRRQFDKDEAVAFLSKRISELQIENGILKSELAELKDGKLSPEHIAQLKTKGWVKDILVDERIKEIQNQLNNLQEKMKSENIQKLKDDVNHWRNKYFDELSKKKT